MSAIKRSLLFLSSFLLFLAFGSCGFRPLEKSDSERLKEAQAPGVQDPALSKEGTVTKPSEKQVLTIAAAASLENVFRELVPVFEARHPTIQIRAVFDASGKLEQQIREGLDADVFMPASPEAMEHLIADDLAEKEHVLPILKNELVLIRATQTQSEVTGFSNIDQAQSIAIGDPRSVPAGKYAQVLLTKLGLWDAVQSKLSLGMSVTEVLNWTGEASAEVGIVYATDAANDKRVVVLEKKADDSIVYPGGRMTQSANKEEAQLFLDFLHAHEAQRIFQNFGFTPYTDSEEK